MNPLLAVVLAVVAMAVGALVAAVVVRRRVARRVAALVVRLDPSSPPGLAAGEPWEQSLLRLARTVEGATALTEREAAAVRRLETALDALPIGVVVAADDGSIVLHNTAAAHFAGTHHTDALVLDAVGEMLALARAGETTGRTLELYGPPRRSVVVRATPFAGGALAVIEDITERTRLEGMRTDFVANISHELKTPVGALALLAETLTGEDDPDVAARLAESIVAESHRVGNTIDDLLELSRIEDGGALAHEVVAVGLLASEAVERVRQLAELRDIRISVDEWATSLAVRGERRQLVSALANLLENGVKYSDPGSIVDLGARSAAGVAGTAWVDLVVRDHGIGIPQRDLERVFERFYRVDRGRSRGTGGTGLGLAIVRHVATNHGGQVSVQSQEGVGSVFTLRVPAAVASAVAPVAPARVSSR